MYVETCGSSVISTIIVTDIYVHSLVELKIMSDYVLLQTDKIYTISKNITGRVYVVCLLPAVDTHAVK